MYMQNAIVRLIIRLDYVIKRYDLLSQQRPIILVLKKDSPVVIVLQLVTLRLCILHCTRMRFQFF